jgi:hypothetical protein
MLPRMIVRALFGPRPVYSEKRRTIRLLISMGSDLPAGLRSSMLAITASDPIPL